MLMKNKLDHVNSTKNEIKKCQLPTSVFMVVTARIPNYVILAIFNMMKCKVGWNLSQPSSNKTQFDMGLKLNESVYVR